MIPRNPAFEKWLYEPSANDPSPMLPGGAMCSFITTTQATKFIDDVGLAFEYLDAIESVLQRAFEAGAASVSTSETKEGE